jgi:nitroreductase
MFMSLIQKRRSIRRFKAQEIEAEKISALIEAALRAPTSRGVQPWEFIIITEKRVLEKLSKAKPHGSAFLKNAPLGIVVCAAPDISDVWIEDSSIACAYIQLAAESLGLGTCWIQIRERMHDDTKSAEQYISELLHIPENLKIGAMIALGYPDEKKSPRGKKELLYEKVHRDSYGKGYIETQ